jgi:6-pyruvoyltetrahydropterin/6-carboxytetrahydropterin synthase
MTQIVRRLHFCAGHRVVGHEGKCRHPHGHNYIVYLHARSNSRTEELDEVGRVIDFGVLKERIGGWIEENWDHAFIVWAGDEELLDALGKMEAKTFIMPANPTAENLAHYLLYTVSPLLIDEVEIYQVDLEETENCMAIVRLE